MPSKQNFYNLDHTLLNLRQIGTLLSKMFTKMISTFWCEKYKCLLIHDAEAAKLRIIMKMEISSGA